MVAASHRNVGTIKSVKHAEGFGFITHAATGEDYFFHRSQLIDTSWDDVEPDLLVEFDPVQGPKGLRAMNVRVKDY